MAYRCEKYGGECDGCGDCQVPLPKCPKCGEQCTSFYKSDDVVVGCNKCVREVESYERT